MANRRCSYLQVTTTLAVDALSKIVAAALEQYGRPFPCRDDVDPTPPQDGSWGSSEQLFAEYPNVPTIDHVSPLRFEMVPVGALTVTEHAEVPRTVSPPGQACSPLPDVDVIVCVVVS
jgi:hypothetical protein